MSFVKQSVIQCCEFFPSKSWEIFPSLNPWLWWNKTDGPQQFCERFNIWKNWDGILSGKGFLEYNLVKVQGNIYVYAE